MKPDNLYFYERNGEGESAAIISVPLELGSDERGHAATPQYLFESGLEDVFRAIGREISSKHAIACAEPPAPASAGTLKNVKEIISVAKRTAALCEKAIRRGDTALVLGGDHSVSIGSIAGAANALSSLGVIYIDAHPDCNTDATTITGNIHGMVGPALMGEGNELLRVGKRTIAPEHFLYIALKDIDPAEIEYLRSKHITVITMLDIATHGLSPALRAINALAANVERVWVSMDMDSIDEIDAPGVALSSKGGLTAREALSLAHYIGKSCSLAGMDIVEIVPHKDVKKKTAQLALELIARFLGAEYSWYSSYIHHYKEINIAQSEEKVEVRRERALLRKATHGQAQ